MGIIVHINHMELFTYQDVNNLQKNFAHNIKSQKIKNLIDRDFKIINVERMH